MSIGNGGGTGISGNTNNYDLEGQYNLQDAYNSNVANINQFYFVDETESNNYIRSSINNHYWYGGLSTINYNNADVLIDKTSIEIIKGSKNLSTIS